MRALSVLLATSAILFSACTGGTAGTASPAPATSAPTAAAVTATARPATATPAATDVKTVAQKFLSTIPDGFWAVGTVDALKTAQASGAYVIDIREPNEYAESHIPGAVNIPLRSLTTSLDKIPRDRTVIVHCRSGYRAGFATAALHMLGYTNVRNFTPAMLGWEAAKEPVTKDPTPTQSFGTPKTDPALMATVGKWLSSLPTDLYGAGTLPQYKEAIAAGTMISVDVREPSEFKDGHIPGAVNIPIRDLGKELAKLPTDKRVAVYCRTNHRAAMSVAALHMLGMTNARVFGTNFLGWTSAGEPIAK